MALTTNQRLEVGSYKIDYNFVQSKPGSSDRLAVVLLYGTAPNSLPLAELHFFSNYPGFAVSEQLANNTGNYEHVDLLMSTQYLDGICELLRNEKPLSILFIRNSAGVLDNVWFGTTSNEPTGEEEQTRIRRPFVFPR